MYSTFDRPSESPGQFSVHKHTFCRCFTQFLWQKAETLVWCRILIRSCGTFLIMFESNMQKNMKRLESKFAVETFCAEDFSCLENTLFAHLARILPFPIKHCHIQTFQFKENCHVWVILPKRPAFLWNCGEEVSGGNRSSISSILNCTTDFAAIF